MTWQIEMLWQCSICQHPGNRGLKDRYCCNCGHKKDATDPERMPDDTSEAAALAGEAKVKAEAGADWICKYCESNQNQLNKCCGNCGGEREGAKLVSPAQAERIGQEVRDDFQEAVCETEQLGRELDACVELEREDDGRWIAEILAVPGAMAYGSSPREAARKARAIATKRSSIRLVGWCAAALFVALLVWLAAWLFTPRLVEAKVSQIYWQHDTIIDRYQVYRHEGFVPSFGAFEVLPVGMRHHHYDRVHVGSHQESYQDRYACGENCSTSPTYRTCSSNSNGTATCTNHGGNRSCSTKYCSRTAYRTVQDYRDVSRQQMWFLWKIWEWGYNRTVTKSGFTHVTTWPAENELTARLADGERERTSQQESYKVTFTDLKDGETYVIRPANEWAFSGYDLGAHLRLKVNHAGSVQVQ